MLKEYSINNFTIQNDEYFNIEWLIDLFENNIFYDIVINNSNIITHWNGNLYKKKIIKQSVNQDYLKNLNVSWFLFGKQQYQIKNKFLIEHFPNTINWSDIMMEINKYEMKKKIKILEEHLDKIQHDASKFIFGDDIYEYIEQYNIKELFLHNDIKKKFNDIIIEKSIESNINFPIILIDLIDKNQNGSNILLKNYSGILGIKYY